MATRWACVGPGKIAADFFLAIQENLKSEDHEFVAVASRDMTRAQGFAEKFKFQKAYDSYDDVATDTDVVVVYISTLHINHVELSIKMLQAGKHVLCEKPMAMNSKQAKQVLDLAKSKRLLFLEGVWSRWFPVYDRIRQELNAGTLGDIRFVQANFCKTAPHIVKSSIALGGGAMFRIGIYPIQFACMIYGEMPETITAVGNLDKHTGVDESAVVVLKYKNGALANLTYHVDAGDGDNTAVIMGKKGRIEVAHPFHCPTKCTTPSGTYEFPLQGGDYKFINGSGMHYEATATREYIKNGVTESDLYSYADTEMVHAIMDEVRRQLGLKYPDFDP